MIEQVKVPATKSNYITSIPGPTYSQRRDPPQLTALPHSHSHHTCAHTFHNVLLFQKCPSSAPVA